MNIGIIGLGLMGASFGKAVKKYTRHTVYGGDRDDKTVLKAELTGAIDCRLTEGAYKLLDILLFAVNPRAFCAELPKYLPRLTGGAIVTDVCGDKRNVVRAMRDAAKLYPDIKFIAAHPMAGREFSGVNYAIPTLFEKASVLVVPVTMDIAALAGLKKLFLEIGCAEVLPTNAEYHDKMIAFTSQAAHVISSCYVKSPAAESHDGFSAGSFKDLTRVARLNPEMWTELIMDNADNVLPEVGAMIDRLSEVKRAIEDGDEAELTRLLREGSERKERIDKFTRARRREM
jgi:prephenate dehydrogenase